MSQEAMEMSFNRNRFFDGQKNVNDSIYEESMHHKISRFLEREDLMKGEHSFHKFASTKK